MNQKQENRLSMNRAVRNELFAHRSTWENMKPMVKAVAALEEGIKRLDNTVVRQANTSKGITIDKEALATIAVDLVLKIAANVKAYALEEHNQAIYVQVDYNRTRLLTMSDNEQLAVLHTILNTSEGIVAVLKDYNVTASTIARTRNAVAALGAAMVLPRMAINARRTATLLMIDYEQDVRLALDKLDNMMHNFEEINPVLVSNYKQARIVVDYGIRHTGGRTAKAVKEQEIQAMPDSSTGAAPIAPMAT